MIINYAIKELLVSMKTIRFIVAILVCCLLMPLSVWVLSSDFLRDAEDFDGRVAMEERREAGKNMKVAVSRPIPQLSPLFRGVTAESINSIELSYYLGWNRGIAAASQSVTHEIFPSVDLTFIVGMILSALALMLSFDAVSGEKAEATLRLLMSYSLSRWKVILGKWIGLFLAILIPFILGLLISLLIFFSVTGVTLTTDNWIALGLATLLMVCFISVFVLLGILVSAFTKSPTVSIFVCLGVWGLMTIILPQLANVVSDSVAPIPSRQKIEKDIRVLYNDFANTIRDHNMKLAEDGKKNPNLVYSEMNRQRNDFEFARVEENRNNANQLEYQYWLQIENQEGIGRNISLVSPYGCLTQGLISLADTGPIGQRAFMRQAYKYGLDYFTFIWDKAFNSDLEDWADIYAIAPKFTYNRTSLDVRMEGALMPMTVLILSNFILLFIAIVAFNRYDVR